MEVILKGKWLGNRLLTSRDLNIDLNDEFYNHIYHYCISNEINPPFPSSDNAFIYYDKRYGKELLEILKEIIIEKPNITIWEDLDRLICNKRDERFGKNSIKIYDFIIII